MRAVVSGLFPPVTVCVCVSGEGQFVSPAWLTAGVGVLCVCVVEEPWGMAACTQGGVLDQSSYRKVNTAIDHVMEYISYKVRKDKIS